MPVWHELGVWQGFMPTFEQRETVEWYQNHLLHSHTSRCGVRLSGRRPHTIGISTILFLLKWHSITSSRGSLGNLCRWRRLALPSITLQRRRSGRRNSWARWLRRRDWINEGTFGLIIHSLCICQALAPRRWARMRLTLLNSAQKRVVSLRSGRPILALLRSASLRLVPLSLASLKSVLFGLS